MTTVSSLPYSTFDFMPGNRRLIGQQQARRQLRLMLQSTRLSHAYLIAGPPGSGKKALALCMAELINGIDHLTDLSGHAFSKKSSWAMHPDIHMFVPLPGSKPDMTHLRERRELLAKDPYEITDFSLRPEVSEEGGTKNKNAFYAIDYYKEHIQNAAFFKRNEGFRKVIIISEIERMRKEAANAFLKMLEEPPEGVMFILTTDNANMLLPTIISRCQLVRTRPFTEEEMMRGLMDYDGFGEEDARFLSRISAGNYSVARFHDVAQLRQNRGEILDFLRASYSMDATALLGLVQQWSKAYNKEALCGIIDLLEVLVRDLAYFRASGEEALITNVDQLEVIKKFCAALGNARLQEMQQLFTPFRGMIQQNVNPKLVFTVLAFRMARLMRGKDTALPEDKPWLHLPAFEERL
ncbi:MAG: ATP-binding protein [Cyclonatronaceae bacterium]